MKRTTCRVRWLLAALLAVSTAVPAEEWIRPGSERWLFSAGIFLPEFDTRVRVNNATVGGVGIRLEDRLNLTRRKSTGYVAASWRFAPRHRLAVGRLSFDRDSILTATEDIEVGEGEVIAAGARLQTRFDAQIWPIDYAYSFVNDARHELAGFVGVHWTRFEYAVSASAWAEDRGGDGRISARTRAPMPQFGLRYRYNVSPRWTVGVSAGYFEIETDSSDVIYSGSLYTGRLDTEYWLWRNVAAGAALDVLGLDVDINDDDWKGSLDYRYWGPLLYLRARF